MIIHISRSIDKYTRRTRVCLWKHETKAKTKQNICTQIRCQMRFIDSMCQIQNGEQIMYRYIYIKNKHSWKYWVIIWFIKNELPKLKCRTDYLILFYFYRISLLVQVRTRTVYASSILLFNKMQNLKSYFKFNENSD